MPPMTRVLLTSFEPFGRMAVNSSLEVGRAVAARPPRGIELEWLVLPVVAGECVRQARAAIEQWEPTLVLSLGQAGGASALRIEKRAANLDDFAAPDNAGNLRRRQAIVVNGPPFCRATVKVDCLVRELGCRGLTAEASASAGTFVCNHLFYELLHRALPDRCASQTGFLHLPLLPGQVQRSEFTPSRSLNELVQGVRLAIAGCVNPRSGCSRSKGSTS
jgi:pyroglutamyl-peptidase